MFDLPLVDKSTFGCSDHGIGASLGLFVVVDQMYLAISAESTAGLGGFSFAAHDSTVEA